jgi:presenilin-like A22 family membrane protease
MKHTLKFTIVIIVAFLITQLIGLLIFNLYDHNFGETHIKYVQEAEEKNITLPPQPNVTIMEFTPPPIQTKEPIDFVKIILNILIAIVLAIVIFFVLSKIGIIPVLKGWFAFVVFICLAITFTLLLYPFVGSILVNVIGLKISLAEIIAVPFSIILTFFKVFRRHFLVHNLTEFFIYPGFSIVLIPILNVVIATALLLAISIYDIVSVWRSNYMVSLANFQIKHLKFFAGFFIPYLNKGDMARIKSARIVAKSSKKNAKKNVKGVSVKVAALGGGDIAIPMVFLGTVFLTYGLAAYFVVLAFILASLAYLLFQAEDKAYPAMPFLTVGSLIGLFIVLLI